MSSFRHTLVKSLLRWIKLGALGFLALTSLLVLLFRWLPWPTSSFMLQYQLSHWHVPGARPLIYHWVPMERIAAPMQLAVVASEDQKFPEHWGFDFDSMFSALQHNRHGQHIRGASTISQQVAKNLFLWSGRNYVRKVVEAYFTVLIETLWSKQRILEVYLNVAEFGEGIYGVDAAAHHFFAKPAAQLNMREASLLAAVLPNPKRYLVRAPNAYVLEHAQWIRQQMGNLGLDYLGF